MFRSLFALLPFLLLLPAAARAQEAAPAEGPERLEAAAQAFAEAKAACEADAGALWGRPLWGPFMLVDRATRVFVANEPIAPGEEGASPTRAVSVGEAEVHVGRLPEHFSVANTAADYAGKRWAMAVWPIPESPEARRQLLCHELWHRIQGDLGLSPDTPPNNHLDEEQGRLWLRLEMRALAGALRADDEVARRRATADALMFRAHRHALLEGAADAEGKLEIAEGLAEYTGLRHSGRADPAAWSAQELDRAEAGDGLVRGFAYSTGPAYGLLLDSAAPNWRQGLNAGSDLAALLATATGLAQGPPGEPALEEAMARYEGATVRNQERERAKQREAVRRELLARLVEGAVLEVPMQDARISFNPRNVVPLPPHGTVYPGGTITAPWGTLRAADGELLIATGWDKAFVSTPTGLEIAGDKRSATGGAGWVLTLEPGWRIEEADGRAYVRKQAGDEARE